MNCRATAPVASTKRWQAKRLPYNSFGVAACQSARESLEGERHAKFVALSRESFNLCALITFMLA
jgi:hypothetical protein